MKIWGGALSLGCRLTTRWNRGWTGGRIFGQLRQISHQSLEGGKASLFSGFGIE